MLTRQVKQKKQSDKKTFDLLGIGVLLAVLGAFGLGLGASPLALADSFDAKIRVLDAENSQNSETVGQLGAQADGLQAKIHKLQVRISAMEAKIIANQKKENELKKKIAIAQAELVKQKRLLGATIKAMYLEGDISTVEMLASSKNLSDFFDKAQYRESIRAKIKTTLDKVTQLKLELNTQKQNVEKLLKEQRVLHSQLASQQGEQNHLLNLNTAQRSAINSDIRHNNARISQLRAEQAAANAAHFSGYTIVPGHNGRDSYPDVWRNAPQDSMLDSWGMYNRECVSYTAWKVSSTGRNMPGWGWSSKGNAKQWPDNARSEGIPVDGNPRAGDVAIAYWGAYGHAMYVDSVNSDGTINISQYNWDFNGTYSEIYRFSSSGLSFIHFR